MNKDTASRSDASTMTACTCLACGRPICDRFLLRVGDASYHEKCLACAACGAALQHTCYVRHAKPYCRLDYDRMYAKRCLGCGEAVAAEELVMRAQDEVFHVRCFVCVVCGGRLQRGDHYVLKQGQLFCRPDYDKEVEMFQGYTQGEIMCDELVTNRCSDGRRGPKRPRTILTTQQRRAFKASFEMSPKPCRKIREGLAKDTGLSVRIVQVWFQNQRAKMKKIQKKARDGKANSCGVKEETAADGDKAKIKIKEENQSPHGLAMFLNDSCSDNDLNAGDDHQVDAHRHFMPIKEELSSQDGFYKGPNAGIMPDFAGLPNSGDKLSTATFLNFPYMDHGPHHHHHHHQQPHQHQQQHQQTLQQFLGGAAPAFVGQHYGGNPSLNPIDRLYSMQNSYFCQDDAASAATAVDD